MSHKCLCVHCIVSVYCWWWLCHVAPGWTCSVIIMGTILSCRAVACNLNIQVASREYKGKTASRGQSKDPHISVGGKKWWQRVSLTWKAWRGRNSRLRPLRESLKIQFSPGLSSESHSPQHLSLKSPTVPTSVSLSRFYPPFPLDHPFTYSLTTCLTPFNTFKLSHHSRSLYPLPHSPIMCILFVLYFLTLTFFSSACCRSPYFSLLWPLDLPWVGGKEDRERERDSCGCIIIPGGLVSGV